MMRMDVGKSQRILDDFKTKTSKVTKFRYGEEITKLNFTMILYAMCRRADYPLTFFIFI